jgi:hypothetical protein
LYSRQEHSVLGGALCLPCVHLLEQKVLIEGRFDVELDGVVAGRDGLDVPLDIVVLLHLLDVVDVVDHKEGNEHSCAPNVETFYLARWKIFLRHDTADLDEHLGVRCTALNLIEALFGALNEGAEPGEGAGGFADAVSFKGYFDTA